MEEKKEKIVSDILEVISKYRKGEHQVYPSFCDDVFTWCASEILVEIPYYPREVVSALTGKKYTTYYNVEINIYLYSFRAHVERYKIESEQLREKLKEILSKIDINDIDYVIVSVRKAPYSLDPTLNNLSPDATRPFNPFLP